MKEEIEGRHHATLIRHITSHEVSLIFKCRSHSHTHRGLTLTSLSFFSGCGEVVSVPKQNEEGINSEESVNGGEV